MRIVQSGRGYRGGIGTAMIARELPAPYRLCVPALIQNSTTILVHNDPPQYPLAFWITPEHASGSLTELVSSAPQCA
jgi:hypothetical protein